MTLEKLLEILRVIAEYEASPNRWMISAFVCITPTSQPTHRTHVYLERKGFVLFDDQYIYRP